MARLNALPIALPIALLTCGLAHGQTQDLLAPVSLAPVSLKDAVWLSGCWQGEAFGSPAQECWMPGPDGRMTGMFELMSGGTQTFSEIFVLADFGDGPELRLKHFHPDMTGWEEKDDFVSFPLLAVAPGVIRFEGLVYSLQDDATLLIALDMKNKEGAVFTEEMRFTRIDFAPQPHTTDTQSGDIQQ